jgi:hypothetical protein
MANIHILEQAQDKKTVRTVFHYAVSAADNAVGVPWSAALLKHLGGEQVSIIPDHATEFPVEAAAMANGTVLEHQATVRFSRLGLTNAEKLAEIQAAYTNKQNEVMAELQVKLNYYGHTV